jgi:hypothetical protein
MPKTLAMLRDTRWPGRKYDICLPNGSSPMEERTTTPALRGHQHAESGVLADYSKILSVPDRVERMTAWRSEGMIPWRSEAMTPWRYETVTAVARSIMELVPPRPRAKHDCRNIQPAEVVKIPDGSAAVGEDER